MFVILGLTGAMVARLPTEQEVVGSSPTLGLYVNFARGRGIDTPNLQDILGV
jgi:hypothetical protein